MLRQGWLLALGGKAADAIQVITSSLTANRPMETLEAPIVFVGLGACSC